MVSVWFNTFRAHVAYRLDRFLRLHGLVQGLILVAITSSLVLAFALLLGVSGGAPEAHSVSDCVWWVLGRFSDGGTMYTDHGGRLRALAIVVTWTAIFVVQFMTGAVTAKLIYRLDQLRSGRSPVVELGHVLVLGFDSRVPLIGRELARSHQSHMLVVLAESNVNDMDLALRPARQIPRNRLRIETRTGDPRDENNLLRVAADRAKAVLILSPEDLDDDASRRWSFSALLALRRVVGRNFSGHVVVETRHEGRDELYRAAAEPCDPSSDGDPLRLTLLPGDDIIARLLAQSVRQLGVYFVLREVLSFRGAELYFEPLPRRLVGKTFGQVHARVVGAIVVGIQPRVGLPILNPLDNLRINDGDRLIVLAKESGMVRVGPDRKLPSLEVAPSLPPSNGAPMAVVVLGDNRGLPEFTVEVVSALPLESSVKVIAPGATAKLDGVRDRCARAQLVCVDADPCVIASNPPNSLLDADAVVILGSAAEQAADADAAALETLVCLRHAERKRGKRIARLVTELRHVSSATHVTGNADDFLVSSELLGLLMAQLVVTPELQPVLHDDLLNPGGNDVFLRPRQRYVGDGPATFAQVMGGARRHHEVAIGLYDPSRGFSPPDLRLLLEGRAETSGRSPVHLAPNRNSAVPLGALVIVIARTAET